MTLWPCAVVVRQQNLMCNQWISSSWTFFGQWWIWQNCTEGTSNLRWVWPENNHDWPYTVGCSSGWVNVNHCLQCVLYLGFGPLYVSSDIRLQSVSNTMQGHSRVFHSSGLSPLLLYCCCRYQKTLGSENLKFDCTALMQSHVNVQHCQCRWRSSWFSAQQFHSAVRDKHIREEYGSYFLVLYGRPHIIHIPAAGKQPLLPVLFSGFGGGGGTMASFVS